MATDAVEVVSAGAPLVEGELTCPMCEYDLRGLGEPRCPECGYTFTWEALRAARGNRHPYLFEHHPERNVWSFWKTAWHGLATPLEFWRTLHPGQASKPKRLVMYWGVAVVVLAGAVVGEWAVAVVQLGLSGSPGFGRGARAGSASATFLQNVWNMQPAPWTLEFMENMWRRDSLFAAGWVVLIAVVLWPTVTYLSLLIFQQSMRRVKVRPVHALRCVLYTADIFGWAAPALVLFGLATMMGSVTDFGRLVMMFGVPVVLGVEVMLIVRLSIAYSIYMKFDRAVWTVIATQLIVGLVALNVLAWGFG